jgi:hypothetical protein
MASTLRSAAKHQAQRLKASGSAHTGLLAFIFIHLCNTKIGVKVKGNFTVDTNTNFGVDSMWTFLACPAPGGGRPLDRFVQDLGDEAVNNLTAVLEALQVIERKYWIRPQFDVLSDYSKMGEIRFDGDKKTYRVFGYFGPQNRRLHFTLLLGCEKKRNLKHEMDLAARRRDFAEQNVGLLYAFTIKSRPSPETQ